MTSRSGQETGKQFDILVSGRTIEKESVLASLSDPESIPNIVQLRSLIVNALKKDFAPRNIERQQDYNFDRDTKAVARSWLLSALARISEGDPEARSLVREHLNPKYEPNRWARHEALAGLFVAKSSDLLELAGSVNVNDEQPWTQMLAIAILAYHGDRDALHAIKENLSSKNNQVATLRALRTVPIEELVGDLIKIVRSFGSGGYQDYVIYDTVIALGCIPNTWPEAPDAAESLLSVIKQCHKWPWYIDLWCKALRSLGNLKLAVASPWLVDELTNDNPSIIFEAAVALEKVLGTSSAAVRIVEIAANLTDRMSIEAYANPLRWMNRGLVVEKLEQMMVSGLAEQQETARILLIALGGLSAFQKVQARRAAIDQYMKQLEIAEKQIRTLFETSIFEAQKGFRIATYMDLMVFSLGVVLIGVSSVLALNNQGSLESWAGVGITTGGAGVLGILYTLIKDPRHQISKEVDHLMFLKVVFLGYLRQLHQTDQAYTRRLLEDQQLETKEMEDFSNLIGKTMKSAMEEIARVDALWGTNRASKGITNNS